jgi:drug/metabolite transporter (DMT)-like permease
MISARLRALPWAPLLFVLLWSGGYSMAKLGLRHAEPMTFLALRYFCVVGVMAAAFMLVRPRLPARPISWLHLAVSGLLIQAMYFGLSYLAFADGLSAGGVALIVSLQPILVAIAAPWIVSETVSRYRWMGLLLGLAGAALVIASRQEISTASYIGVVFATAALISMSAASIYEKRFGVHQHPVTAGLVQFSVGLLVIAPIAWWRETMTIEFNAELWWSLAYLVIGNSIIAVTLLLYMIRAGEVSRVSALLFLVPPAASLLAWAILDEAMPPLAWLGMLVACAGVALSSQTLKQRQRSGA